MRRDPAIKRQRIEDRRRAADHSVAEGSFSNGAIGIECGDQNAIGINEKVRIQRRVIGKIDTVEPSATCMQDRVDTANDTDIAALAGPAKQPRITGGVEMPSLLDRLPRRCGARRACTPLFGRNRGEAEIL